jgi:hypothetical protein
VGVKGLFAPRGQKVEGSEPQARIPVKEEKSDTSRFTRDVTPRTLADVRRNETSENGVEGYDSGYSSWHSSFSEKDLGHSGLENSLLTQMDNFSHEGFWGTHEQSAGWKG